jgi:hypothetical protein
VVEKCLNLTFASRGDIAEPTVETLKILLDASITEAEQLYRALYACVEVSLTSGSVEALGTLFDEEEGGGDVDGRLKNLIGQVCWVQMPGIDLCVMLYSFSNICWPYHL